jgi:hypothetical protein
LEIESVGRGVEAGRAAGHMQVRRRDEMIANSTYHG